MKPLCEISYFSLLILREHQLTMVFQLQNNHTLKNAYFDYEIEVSIMHCKIKTNDVTVSEKVQENVE